jgi:hypothetical protein
MKFEELLNGPRDLRVQEDPDVPGSYNLVVALGASAEAPDPYIAVIASADTAQHAFGAQAVKGKVRIDTDPGMAGTLMISVGLTPGVVLGAGKTIEVPCSNLNQLAYKFSTNAGTEKFSVLATI